MLPLEILFQVMLPKTDDLPSHFTELLVIVGISFSSLGYLCLPEIRHLVFPGLELVAVPKVAIDKNSHFALGKNNVWFSRQIAEVLTKPESLLVKGRSHEDLWASVLTFDAGHAVASLMRCQIIGHFVTSLETD